MSESAAPRRKRPSPPPFRWIASAVLLSLLLVGLALLSRPKRGPRAPGSPESAPATVTVETAELKSEPSSSARTLARLARGARVEAGREVGLWTEARSGGLSGYLPSEAIERDADRQARERRAGVILKFEPVTGVVAEDADLRAAPFPMAARVGRVEKGETVRLYAVDHDYFALRGPEGALVFVDSKSVDLIPPDPSRPAITPATGRAPKNVEVTELAQPLPLPPGEEPPPAEGAGAPGGAAAPPPPGGVAGEPAVEAATLLTKTNPVYPEAARRMGTEGTVVLEATIGADGSVTEVRVVRGLPFGLSESAVAAVRRWKYRPARGRSGPVASTKEIRIEFRLRT